VRVDHSVSAVRSVEVPVFFSLRSSCNHVSEVGYRTFRDAQYVAMQNGGDTVDTITNRLQSIVLTIKANEMHYFSASSNSSKYCLTIAGRSLSSFRIIAPVSATIV